MLPARPEFGQIFAGTSVHGPRFASKILLKTGYDIYLTFGAVF
jgi:hypothetical protein